MTTRQWRVSKPNSLVFILVVVFAVASTIASPFKKNRLQRRNNDKFPTTIWSKESKKSSPITYVSTLPFASWFSKEPVEEQVAEKRSHHSRPISNSIADDFLGKYYLKVQVQYQNEYMWLLLNIAIHNFHLKLV